MAFARVLAPAIFVPLLALSGCEHAGIFEPFREVECLQRAPINLQLAVARAEAGGGKALDADYRQDEELGCERGKAGVFDVTLFANGTISVVSVDAATGVLGAPEPENVMNAIFGGGPRVEGSPADMADMSLGMPLALGEAIRSAEQGGGKAMAGWIEAKDGRPGYTLKVVERGRVNVIWLPGDGRA